MEKSLSYPGKFADADIKISRCCPCGEAEILKKASRISAKLKLADADIKISRRCPAGNQRSLFRAKRRRESNAEILKKASRSSAKLKEAFMLKKRGFYIKEKRLLY